MQTVEPCRRQIICQLPADPHRLTITQQKRYCSRRPQGIRHLHIRHLQILDGARGPLLQLFIGRNMKLDRLLRAFLVEPRDSKLTPVRGFEQNPSEP